MERERYVWQDACVAALTESDVRKKIALVERAITAIERRYAEWRDTPGTPRELKAIRRGIHDLEDVLRKFGADTEHSDLRSEASKRVVTLRSSALFGNRTTSQSGKQTGSSTTRRP
jgi:hypothetical protein